MKREHIGSDFDDFLKAEHLLAECEAGALKRVIACEIEQEMKRRKISRAKLATRMKTNRANIDRLFSEEHVCDTATSGTSRARLRAEVKSGIGIKRSHYPGHDC